MLGENHCLHLLEIKVKYTTTITTKSETILWWNVFRLGDLEHIRAVKPEKHHQFAKDRDMLSYFVSAKTGESVENLFRQVTAHLMHIVLPKNDHDGTKVITASITRQEPQNSTPIKSSTTHTNQTRTSICVLQ